MELPEYQKTVAEFVSTHNLEIPIQFRLLDLVSEVGELSKEVLKQSSYGKSGFTPGENWQEELGDVFFSLICLANSTNLNLEPLLEKALHKYSQRLAQKGQPDSGC